MADVGIRITAIDATKSVFSEVHRGLDSMSFAAAGLQGSLASIGAGLSVGALAAFAKNILNGVDALNDLKDATGASIENISALEDVAARTGTSFDTVSSALVKFNGALKSAKPDSDAEKALKALGLSVKALKDLDPAEALLQVSQSLSQFADDGNKARIVQELFGKSLKEVAPLLKDLAEKGALVATVTKEQAEEAEKLNKELFNLQKNATDAGRALVGPMAEAINKTIELFRQGSKEGKGFWETLRGEQLRILGMNDGQKEYAARIAEISVKLTSGNLHLTQRNALLREQAALQAKLAKFPDYSADNESAAEKSRLQRKLSLGDPLLGGPKKDGGTPADPFASERAAAQSWAKYYEDFAGMARKSADEVTGLTAAQAKLNEYLQSPAYAYATESARQLALEQAYGAIAAEQMAAAQKSAAEEMSEAVKDYADAYDAQQKFVDSLREQIDAERESLATIGLTKDALADRTVQKLEERALDKELMAMRQSETREGQALAELYREQANGLRELAGLKRAVATKEIAADAAKQAVADWRRAADQIEQALTDSLMRGFESGKSMIANLRDTIVNTFKTMVLRPIVQAVVSPFSQAASGMFGLSGGANAASAAGGIGNASSAFSIGGLGNPFTNIGGFLSNGVADFGTALVDKGFTQLGSSFESFGLSMKANEAAINGFGDALGYLNTAVLASEGKWGAALGSGIGTYFGGPIGSVIGQAIGGWVDDAFGGGREYTTGTGISGKFSSSGFMGRNYQDWQNDGSSGFFGIGASGSSRGTNYSALNAGTAKSLGAAFQSVQLQTAGFATVLGLQADSILNFSKDIRVALGSDAAANKQAITDLLTGIASDLANTVLDSQYIRESETAASTLARLATNLQAVNLVFTDLGKTTLSISQLGGDNASQLVDLMGGLQSFNTANQTYYQSFYTQAERNANTAQQLAEAFDSLQLTMPDSLQGYRDLVNAQDTSTDSGRKMYASLIGISGAFASVNAAAADAASSLLKAFRFSTYVDYAASNANAGAVPVPRFAGGGAHVGGLRIVGENGPELEATGAARIWNASQIGGALGGSTAAELKALREDSRAQASAITTLTSRMVKIFDTWDINGMPEVRTV